MLLMLSCISAMLCDAYIRSQRAMLHDTSILAKHPRQLQCLVGWHMQKPKQHGLCACRRIPNSHLDQQIMAQGRRNTLVHDYTAWVRPSPVLSCTVWWGCLGSRSPAPSDHTLTVVTEMPMEGALQTHHKELCIEQYGCAVADKPSCTCALDTTDSSLLGQPSRRSSARYQTFMWTTLAPALAGPADGQHHVRILQDISSGLGHPLAYLLDLGVRLPQQTVTRRYFSCETKPLAKRMCMSFFD